MTTTDEEIMKAAREVVAYGYGTRITAAYRRGDFDQDKDVQTAAKAIRSERARTQAIAAAAWVAGRDAAEHSVANTSKGCVNDGGFDREIGPIGCWMGDDCICRAVVFDIRALTPPAEFAAPEDKRDTAIIRLRELNAHLADKIIKCTESIDYFRAQVSERDALLRVIRNHTNHPMSRETYARIDAVLSKAEG